MVVITTRFSLDLSLPYESELYMANELGISLWRVENPSNINLCYLRIFRPSALFVDVFKHVTLPIGTGTTTQRGPVSISCNISTF